MRVEPRAGLAAPAPSGQRDHTRGTGHVVTEGHFKGLRGSRMSVSLALCEARTGEQNQKTERHFSPNETPESCLFLSTTRFCFVLILCGDFK